jgi:hypothetical protein
MQHQIYFCHIQIKHTQCTSETNETYGCNMCSSTCCPQWTLIDAELDAGTEVKPRLSAGLGGRREVHAERSSRHESRAAHGAKARGAGGAREARRRGRKGQAGASRPGRQTFGREHYRFKLLQFLEREPC